jgi:uncharacterized Zn finger protein
MNGPDRRDRPGWYRSPPKQPAPEHGIKVKKPGTTWWGQRWIEALERMSQGYSNRLARGRSYARSGRTHDLTLTAGRVTAEVTGTRSTPYKVTIELQKLPDAAWQRAIEAMAKKAQFAAELMAGRMPLEIDEAFATAGASLFPVKVSDLFTECSCPDWANPCKHVAATHFVLGEALDRDPFLLLELRGRKKHEVLEALRIARGSERQKSTRRGRKAQAITEREVEIPKLRLKKLARDDYDKPRGAPPALHLSFDAPVAHGALLKQLGAPTAWSGGDSPAELFAPLLRAAAEKARRLALDEPEPESNVAEPPRPKRGSRRP